MGGVGVAEPNIHHSQKQFGMFVRVTWVSLCILASQSLNKRHDTK